MNSKVNLEEEMKYNKIEKLIAMNPEENILYCTASENGLYILTDKDKFLIYENPIKRGEKYTKDRIKISNKRKEF